jgi:hypothetical protein
VGVSKRGKESPVSKESTIKAIDVALDGLRWAKMRGEHEDAVKFQVLYAELVDLANEVYGTLWIGVYSATEER